VAHLVKQIVRLVDGVHGGEVAGPHAMVQGALGVGQRLVDSQRMEAAVFNGGLVHPQAVNAQPRHLDRARPAPHCTAEARLVEVSFPRQKED